MLLVYSYSKDFQLWHAYSMITNLVDFVEPNQDFFTENPGIFAKFLSWVSDNRDMCTDLLILMTIDGFGCRAHA